MRSRGFLFCFLMVLSLGAFAFFAGAHVLPDNEIVVGIYFPRIGSGSFLAKNLQESVLWAIDYCNVQETGLKFRPVISHNTLPSAAVDELAAEGVSVIIGGGSSRMVQEILPFCRSRGIPLISPSSSAPDLAVAGDLLYRGQHDSRGPGLLAGQLAREEGLSGYLIFTVSDNDAYGASFAGGFFEGAGSVPVRRFTVSGSLTSSTISHVLDEERPFDTAVLVLPDHWSSIVSHQLRLFYPGIKIWIADWGNCPAVARLGGSNMDGIRQTGYFSVNLHELDHPFIRSVNGHYGNAWDPFALEMSYRAVSLLVAASRIDVETGRGIRPSLDKVRWIKGLNAVLPVNDRGDVVAPIRVAHIDKGKWVDGAGSYQP